MAQCGLTAAFGDWGPDKAQLSKQSVGTRGRDFEAAGLSLWRDPAVETKVLHGFGQCGIGIGFVDRSLQTGEEFVEPGDANGLRLGNERGGGVAAAVFQMMGFIGLGAALGEQNQSVRDQIDMAEPNMGVAWDHAEVQKCGQLPEESVLLDIAL